MDQERQNEIERESLLVPSCRLTFLDGTCSPNMTVDRRASCRAHVKGQRCVGLLLHMNWSCLLLGQLLELCRAMSGAKFTAVGVKCAAELARTCEMFLESYVFMLPEEFVIILSQSSDHIQMTSAKEHRRRHRHHRQL